MKLAEKYPYLKKAEAWQTVWAKSDPGRISMHVNQMTVGKTGQPAPVPEGERFFILIVLQEPPSKPFQMEMGPIYPNLGLVGQIGTRADNSNLDADLKQLVADALEPLSDLDATDVSNTAWSTPVDGLQVRLRADKMVWQFGKIPVLKADIRNRGKRKLAVYVGQQLCELQVDKRWYRWMGAERRGTSPGYLGKSSDIGVTPVQNWRCKKFKRWPT